MCTKVAHLKEGEVRLRRDSSLYPRDLDVVSAGHVVSTGRSCFPGLSVWYAGGSAGGSQLIASPTGSKWGGILVLHATWYPPRGHSYNSPGIESAPVCGPGQGAPGCGCGAPPAGAGSQLGPNRSPGGLVGPRVRCGGRRGGQPMVTF